MRPQIVLFGDSITEQSFAPGGWGAALADTYRRKADVILRGYGGYNTRWALFLLDRLFPRGSGDPPAATIIFFGANDAALQGRTSERQHVPLEFYWENLREIVKHLQECSPKMLIVIITPPPIDELGRMEYAKSLYGQKAMTQPERTNEVTGRYAKTCIDVAEDLRVHCIDIWSRMQQTKGWQKLFLSDGLHLTPEGNSLVYQQVLKVLSHAKLSPEEMPNDFPHHSEIDRNDPDLAFHFHNRQ